jgi:hypothetical protein
VDAGFGYSLPPLPQLRMVARNRNLVNHHIMRFPFPTKRRDWFAIALIVPTVVALLFVSGFFQWSPLNCWHDDIDVNSGRVRHTQFLFYCKVVDKTDETWLSRTLKKSDMTPDWHRVNTFSSIVRYSPHYRFHGAIDQIRTLELINRLIPFDPDAGRIVANRLLTSWQKSGDDTDAERFLAKVTEKVFELQEKGASVFASSDVPTD